MAYEVYSRNTTNGKIWTVGRMDQGQLMALNYERTYKTRKGADKWLTKINSGKW